MELTPNIISLWSGGWVGLRKQHSGGTDYSVARRNDKDWGRLRRVAIDFSFACRCVSVDLYSSWFAADIVRSVLRYDRTDAFLISGVGDLFLTCNSPTSRVSVLVD
jgi:hypothetical protein